MSRRQTNAARQTCPAARQTCMPAPTQPRFLSACDPLALSTTGLRPWQRWRLSPLCSASTMSWSPFSTIPRARTGRCCGQIAWSALSLRGCAVLTPLLPHCSLIFFLVAAAEVGACLPGRSTGLPLRKQHNQPLQQIQTPSPLQMAILALFQLHFDQAYFLVALQFLKINQYCLLAVLFFAFMAQLHHMGHLKSRSVLCALLHLTSCPANPNLPPPPPTLLQSHLASTLSACHCAH